MAGFLLSKIVARTTAVRMGQDRIGMFSQPPFHFVTGGTKHRLISDFGVMPAPASSFSGFVFHADAIGKGINWQNLMHKKNS